MPPAVGSKVLRVLRPSCPLDSYWRCRAPAALQTSGKTLSQDTVSPRGRRPPTPEPRRPGAGGTRAKKVPTTNSIPIKDTIRDRDGPTTNRTPPIVFPALAEQAQVRLGCASSKSGDTRKKPHEHFRHPGWFYQARKTGTGDTAPLRPERGSPPKRGPPLTRAALTNRRGIDPRRLNAPSGPSPRTESLAFPRECQCPHPPEPTAQSARPEWLRDSTGLCVQGARGDPPRSGSTTSWHLARAPMYIQYGTRRGTMLRTRGAIRLPDLSGSTPGSTTRAPHSFTFMKGNEEVAVAARMGSPSRLRALSTIRNALPFCATAAGLSSRACLRASPESRIGRTRRGLEPPRPSRSRSSCRGASGQ